MCPAPSPTARDRPSAGGRRFVGARAACAAALGEIDRHHRPGGWSGGGRANGQVKWILDVL